MYSIVTASQVDINEKHAFMELSDVLSSCVYEHV